MTLPRCWTKHSLPADKPTLESASVISILVSASFLKIADLVEECLEFVYRSRPLLPLVCVSRNMNQVLCVTPSFSCVGDTLLTRYHVTLVTMMTYSSPVTILLPQTCQALQTLGDREPL